MHCELANGCNGSVRQGGPLVCSNNFVIWNSRAQWKHVIIIIHSSAKSFELVIRSMNNCTMCRARRDVCHTLPTTEDIIVHVSLHGTGFNYREIRGKVENLKNAHTNNKCTHFRNRMITKKVNATALTTKRQFQTEHTLDTLLMNLPSYFSMHLIYTQINHKITRRTLKPRK